MTERYKRPLRRFAVIGLLLFSMFTAGCVTNNIKAPVTPTPTGSPSPVWSSCDSGYSCNISNCDIGNNCNSGNQCDSKK